MPARGEEALSTTCWLRFRQHSPACKWLSLLQGHTADSSSTCSQPEAQGLFLQSCFLASQRPDGHAVWVYSILNTGFCICFSLNFMKFLLALPEKVPLDRCPSLQHAERSPEDTITHRLAKSTANLSAKLTLKRRHLLSMII